jgi:hypothetical protein
VFDSKAVGWFLLITFGLTWDIEAMLLLRGVSFEKIPPVFLGYTLAGLMWAPTVGAVFTRKAILHESLRVPEVRLRLGHLRPYALVLVLGMMPIMFAIVYGLTIVLGLGQLDLSLGKFLAQLESVTERAPGPAASCTGRHHRHCPWLGYSCSLHQQPVRLRRGIRLARISSAEIVTFGSLARSSDRRDHLGLWHAPLVLMGSNYPGHP